MHHQLPADRWAVVMERQQCIAARLPATVEPLTGKCPERHCRWYLAKVSFTVPRVGIHTLHVLSIHLNNIVAKKSVVPITALEEVLTAANRIARVDIIAGDINMARWKDGKSGAWRQASFHSKGVRVVIRDL